MNRLRKTKQTLLFIIILTITVIVLYILFFNNLKDKNNDISLIVNETDLAIQREIKLKSVKDLIKDTQENRSKLDTYFIADDKIVDFIEDIERLGRYAGASVEVMSVNVGNDAESNISESLNLNLEVVGKWSEVFQFLALIEKMPFKIDISKVNFRVIDNNDIEETSSGVWKSFFSISAIKLK